MKLSTLKLDSLRLLIPLEKVTINPNHTEFGRIITTVNDDGEILSTKENHTYRLNSNPCSSHYLKAITIMQGKAVEVLKLGFSSKTLKENYLQGINLNNIKDIYNFIQSENVVSFSFDSFINARVVDTDICTDIMLKDSNVKETIQLCKYLSIAHKETSCNAFTQEKNTGIEWSSRNSVGEAYTSKQYLKFYAKALELKHHSTLFYDTYIRGSIYDKYLIDNKLLRVETTIKNKAHWKTYNLEISTLKDLLDIDLSKNRTLITRPINYYMTGIKFIKTRTDLTASERAYLYMINSIKENGSSEIKAIIEVSKILEPIHKSNRSRAKKKLIELVNSQRIFKIKKSDSNQLDIITELEKLEIIPTLKPTI